MEFAAVLRVFLILGFPDLSTPREQGLSACFAGVGKLARLVPFLLFFQGGGVHA